MLEKQFLAKALIKILVFFIAYIFTFAKINLDFHEKRLIIISLKKDKWFLYVADRRSWSMTHFIKSNDSFLEVSVIDRAY